ncbi:MAG: hypothetical protein AB7D41_02225 [Arcobacter sp.]|uniref:hypothetical protein n=1 Tax=Arcobacter sp. TaxID=1872629 RepID=UPI003CFEC8B6
MNYKNEFNKLFKSIVIFIKKCKFLIRYKIYNLKSKLLNSWAKLLMILPIIIFLVLLFPQVFNKYSIWYDIPRGLPNIFIIEGTLEKIDLKIVNNVKIQVGGFETFPDEKGNFSLKFISSKKNDIPIIFFKSEKDYKIDKLDFNNTNNLNKTFSLE